MGTFILSRFRVLVPVFLLLSACDSVNSPELPLVELPLVGMAVDSVGDMPREGADLASSRIEVAGGNLIISIRWAPGTFIRDTSRVTIHLDTDQNPLTGAPGINNGGTVDGEVIGAEFLIKMGPYPYGETDIVSYGYAGSLSPWIRNELPCCISYSADGVDAKVPMYHLGYDDGLLNFKVVSSLKVSDTGFSGWLDVMPDAGLPATRVEGG